METFNVNITPDTPHSDVDTIDVFSTGDVSFTPTTITPTDISEEQLSESIDFII